MKGNVIFHVTRRYMKQNKKRTALTFLGIMLMVALMTCVFAGKDTALGYLERLGSLKDGKWHAAIYDAEMSRLDEISALDYVGETAYSTDYGFTGFAPSNNPERPFLYVKAYTEKDFDWMNIKLSQGRFPQNGGEIVISSAAIDDGADIAIGDKLDAQYFERTLSATGYEGASATVLPFYGIALEVGGEPVTVGQDMCLWENVTPSIAEGRVPTGRSGSYTVVGFIDPPGFEKGDSAGYIALTYFDHPESAEKCNMAFKYANVKGAGSYDSIMEIRNIASGSDVDFNNYVLTFSGISTDRSINTIVSGTMVFFVVLIMLASVLLIYNLFGISLDERSRWLGQLSSIGATGRQKRSSIYYECFLLMMFAVPAGLLLGAAMVYGGMRLLKPALGVFAGLEKYTDQCPVKLVFSWKALILIVVMSCLTVLVSAFIPALKVGKIGPMESIRGNDGAADKTEHRLDEKRAARLSAERWLARINGKRQRKRDLCIVRAAAVFMVILTVTLFASDLVSEVTNNVLGYSQLPEYYDDVDYVLYDYSEDKTEYSALIDTLMHEESVEFLKEVWDAPWSGMTDIANLSEQYRSAHEEIFKENFGRYPDDSEFDEYFGDSMFSFLMLDDASYAALAPDASNAGSVSGSDAVPALVVIDGHVSTDEYGFENGNAKGYKYFAIDRMTDLSVGDSFEVESWNDEGGTFTYDVEIAGLIKTADLEKYAERINPSELLLIINRDALAKLDEMGFGGEERFSATCVVGLDGSDPALESRLDEMTDSDSMDPGVMSFDYAVSLSDAIAQIVRIMLLCFVAVVSVICLINLGNSVKSRMIERSPEFAAMRTIGITDRQLRRQLILECGRHILRSTVLSAVLSAALIAGVFLAMNSLIGRLIFRLPWISVICAVVISAAAMLIFTLAFFPAKKGASLIEEIRRNSI